MLRVFTHTVICSSSNASIDSGSIAARIFGPKIGRLGATLRRSSKNVSPYCGGFSGLTMMRAGSVLLKSNFEMNAGGCIDQLCINKTQPTHSRKEILFV